MKIIVDDDCKGKHQSVTARFTYSDCDIDLDDGLYLSSLNIDDLTAYGETKEEVLLKIEAGLYKIIQELKTLHSDVIRGNIEIEEI